MLQAEMYRDAFQVLRARALPSLSHGAETPQHDKYDSNFVVFIERTACELIEKFVSSKVCEAVHLACSS